MASYVLGTHCGHQISACLVRDGEIRVAIDQARLPGGDGLCSDDRAVRYCLDAEGIEIGDVELVVQNASGHRFARPGYQRAERLAEEASRVVTLSQHLAHAYGAFATSPFDRAAVLIIDGRGNAYCDCDDLEGAHIASIPPAQALDISVEKHSGYTFEQSRSSAVLKDFSLIPGPRAAPLDPRSAAHSLGGWAQSLAEHLLPGASGPQSFFDLAAHGRPGVHDFPFFDLSDGRFFVRSDWHERIGPPVADPDDFRSRFRELADLAAWAQLELERALLECTRWLHQAHPQSNLCLAGGVAGNVRARSRLSIDGPFERVFVPSAPGSAGVAVGCAFYGWLAELGGARNRLALSVPRGRSYSDHAIEGCLERYGEVVSYRRSDSVIEDAAELLSDGATIAWFQGGCELPVSPLGHRCVLADPRRPDARPFIRADVTGDEHERPLLASAMAERAEQYFGSLSEDSFAPARSVIDSEWMGRLPAIAEVDGTATVDAVTRERSPALHRLLEAFADRTGLPVLASARLECPEITGVEGPQQAIELLLHSAIDALVIGPYVVVAGEPQGAAADTADEIADRIDALVEAGQDSPEVDGTFNLSVHGLERAWSILIGPDGVELTLGSERAADWSFSFNEETLLAIYEAPARIPGYIRDGRIRVAQAWTAERAAAADVLGELIRVARHGLERPIRRRGRYFDVDDDGYLANPASLDDISERHRPVLDGLAAMASEHFGPALRCIYAAGSIVGGGDEMPELDAWILLEGGHDDSWGPAQAKELRARYPFLGRVNLRVQRADEVEPKSPLLLTTLCVYGRSLPVPKLKPGTDLVVKAFTLAERIAAFRSDATRYTALRRPFVESLLEIGQELVMQRTQRYSRDPYRWYENFVSCYPGRDEEMRFVLKCYINPRQVSLSDIARMSELGDWMVGEIDKHLGPQAHD